MPRLMGNADNMDGTVVIPGSVGGFTFSTTKVEKLTAMSYTLVDIEIDKSGSVHSFTKEIIECLKEAVRSCAKSPRAENLLVRVNVFNNGLDELHGFLPLKDIDPEKYDIGTPYGMTALYDALYSGVGSVATFAKTLSEQGYSVNGICIVITDGMNNDSTATEKMVADKKVQAVQDEDIESLLGIVIGVNANGRSGYHGKTIADVLNEMKDNIGFEQFVNAGDANKETLAKVAQFVSKSVSSQSQSLGTGGPSQTLSF